MRIFVGCSASDYIPKKYFDDCKIFLEELFKNGYDLVYGACNEGIMGLSYDIACNYNREVIGIYPEVYKNKSNNINCTKVHRDTISERTNDLINFSDILLFLPGGIGTIYELFSAIEFKRAGEFNKPIIIYNSCGYYDKMLDLLELTYNEDFALRIVEENYYVCDNASDAIKYVESFDYNKNKIKKRI